MIDLMEIEPVSETRYYRDASEIDEMELALGTRFPAGYREFITTFGEGVLAGYVRVFPPHQVRYGDVSVTEWRKRISAYWFWDEGKDVLTQPRALECVIFADTMDGDELAFHPEDPDRAYVFPRYEEMLYAIDGGLMPAIDWLLNSGVLTEPIADRTFKPFDGKSLG